MPSVADQKHATIFIVDDDDAILEITKRSLEADGYRVTAFSEGESAASAVGSQAPDLLILDVMLPGADGFEICRRIRAYSSLPIILLTAKGDTIDVVVGLESGADDYVTKPFEMRELVARIRSLMRRVRSRGDDAAVRVGPLEVRPSEGTVLRDGVPLSLTKTEFKLLCTLASGPKRVFSRETLLEEVWGYDYFGDPRLVDVHVRRLRAKVEDDPSHPQWIRTIRGLGYKLEGED